MKKTVLGALGVVAILFLVLTLRADSIISTLASLLAQHTSTVPVGSGAATANITCNAGGTAFSQCGFIHAMGGMNYSGYFENLQVGLPNNYASLFDYIDGVDRVQAVNGISAPVFLNPLSGFVGVGPTKNQTPAALSVAGNQVTFDPTQLAAETLTNPTFSGSGTSWTSTNDCSFGATSAICSFSAGTASTVSQASGTLALPGVGNRMYKYAYTVSGLTGSPAASLAGTFANAGTPNPANLDLTSAGAKVLYFLSVGAPTNFTISTTLTSGQAFTLTATSLKQITGGNDFVGGLQQAQTYGTATNCSSSGGTCGSAAAGSVTIAAAATAVTVNTTAVTINSQINVTEDQSLGTKLGVTCNTQSLLVLGAPRVTARSGGTSFQISIDVGPTTNPMCIGYTILN